MATAAQTIEIYNNVLQRDPTQAEIAAFVAGSQTPADEATQIDLLVNSPEASEDVYPFLRVYQAIFGRVPDAAGLNFWVDAMRSGLTLQTLITGDEDLGIDGFANSAEFEATYGEDVDPTSEEFVTALYQNLLGRAPDAEGLEFYTGLPEGTPVGDLVAAFTESPEFSGAIDAQIAIFLEKAAIGAQDYVGSVYDIDDDGDVDEDDVVEDNPGDTFTLTIADNEEIVGTLGDDTFNALVDGGVPANSTLNAGDTIEGAGGNDTLVLTTTVATDALPTAAQLNSVENITVNATVALTALDASGLEDEVDNINVGGAGALAVTLGAGQSLTLSNAAAVTTAVTVDDAETATTITLDDVASGQVITLTGADNATLTVEGSVAVGGALTINAAADTETVNLGLTSDGVIGVTGAEVTTVDASASTGDLTINAAATVETLVGGAGGDTLSGGAATDLNINAGAGNDAVTLAGQVDATVDLGAGSDTLTLAGTETGLSVTLGSGGDTVVLASIANIADADEADFAADIVVINDFTVGEDVVDIAGSPATLATLNDAQQASIEGAASLFAAVTAAAATGATDPILFDFGGNAYIYHDAAAGGGFNAGDGLVQLTGVASADLDDSNLI